ncbi:MAG TPA: ATP-binding protein [Candidatus Paceibacterota bacterium]|jgi:signal transduction histidine kinase|nr:ATP-binding protein [Candidatus Paceibacterota bacterium]HRT56239.1 ATP-binding protein [Candidatus Paceibacterota bacterium]
MELTRRSLVVYGLLAAVWLLVVIWQIEEHARVREAARTNLSNRSKDIANTVSACIRGMRFRGTVWQDRLEPLLQELVHGRSNELVKASEVVSIVLLNAAGEPVASAGKPVDLSQQDILQKGERWGAHTVVFANPVDLGVSLISQGTTNPTVVLPSMSNLTNSFEPPRGGPPARRDGRMEGAGMPPPPPPRPPEGEVRPGERDGRRDGDFWSRRPFWLRGLEYEDFQQLLQKRAVHGLVLALSTEGFQAAVQRDLWLRAIIVCLATISVLGSGLAWRNLAKSSELQIRLVRASELNTHLKEMNLAAAGLAHETRNPLNIIRGRAQMISRYPQIPPEIGQRAREIIEEADKVAAQLNEFINYSRPREVRRSVLPLGPVVNEVVRALSYDLEEKQIHLQKQGDHLTIEADERLLRQALFNLLMNAIQAVNGQGEIVISAEKRGASEAVIEVRDNGPGVPPERRQEIFKPYFTTNRQGTGLGLAVVQQIVLAHGWEIECADNQPHGAVFRIKHVKLAA